MAIQDCRPPYDYRPDFTPSVDAEGPDCSAPGFIETRARLFAGGTFFRSVNAGATQNRISVEYVIPVSTIVLNVYYKDVLRESFDSGLTPEPPPPPLGSPPSAADCTGTVAKALRTMVNGTSQYIEMPPIDHGGTEFGPRLFQASNGASQTPPGDDCDNLFGPTYLSGGSGPPRTSAGLAAIRTGPERSMVILRRTEIITKTAADPGLLVDPPANQKVRQWDGEEWVPYVPNADCQFLP